MFIINHRKIWFAFSAVLLALSFYAMFVYGFKYSVDFKGGTITEVSFKGEAPDKLALESEIMELELGGFSVRPSEHDNILSYVIRTRELSEAEKQKLIEQTSIHGMFQPLVERSNTIGPTAGAELQSKAVKGVLLVVIMIVLFITFAFKGVSKPVASWKYGLATVISLMHDVIIPTGLFVFLGHILGVEIDLLFVTGLLAVLGYSVHDTIVVFDRVRENLRINQEQNRTEDFEITVGHSLNQTLGRSINTSLTILITLLALYFFGSPATEYFTLLLIVGLIVGTYSSIFVASPLLVTLYKWQKNK